MIETSDAKVKEVLREVVSERPDYIYSGPEYMHRDEDGLACFYVHKDEDGSNVAPGCLIGVVLHRLGVPLEELEKHEGKTPVQMLKDVVGGVSRKTATILTQAQFEQDEKYPWGEAYARATGENI
ncbi:hypothetical protein ACFY5K_25850 [Streptomyces griseofuscus]|uniref:hypothetical protein n=1 Tax=Streptomyces griseofuscus TaxID=146922 RepID=UPI0036C80859